MEIKRNNIDALNATVSITLEKADYAPQVEQVLKNYRKNANVPGFRKGQVPMSMVEKQYGTAAKLEEINKILQEQLANYMQEQKMEVLGNPIPVAKENFDLNEDTITFDFEVGLAPEFAVELDKVTGVTQYTIVADDKMLDEQVLRIRKQFGKVSQKEEIAEGDDVKGTFTNEEFGINTNKTFGLDIFANDKAKKAFIGKKVGDVVEVATKGLFDDDHKFMDYFNLGHDAVHGLDTKVSFTVEGITSTEPAEVNEEFFGKLFGADKITSIEELRAKIKEDAEKQFATQADQKFLNDVTDFLIGNTKFELPLEFLKKWLMQAGEKPLTAEQAQEELDKSEKGLRYQLIEGRVINSNELALSFDDLKDHTAGLIRQQMAQFGQTEPTDEDVNGIVARVLQNQEEVRRLSEQLMSGKLLDLYKSKVKADTKEVTFDEFVKASFGE